MAQPGTGDITPVNSIQLPVHFTALQRRRMRKTLANAIRTGQTPLTTSEGAVVQSVRLLPLKADEQVPHETSVATTTASPTESSVSSEPPVVKNIEATLLKDN
jgi:hypothetical protein